VCQWQEQDPPGRFLEKDDASGFYYAISEKAARKKTSQLLREGAPKIRRLLKNESDEKKKRAATPLPDLIPATAAGAKTPGAEHILTENRTVLNSPCAHGAALNSPRAYGGNAATPLKQIIPEQVNRSTPLQPVRYQYYHHPVSPQPWYCYAPQGPPMSTMMAQKPGFTTPSPIKRKRSSSTTGCAVSRNIFDLAVGNYVSPETTHDEPSPLLISPSKSFESFSLEEDLNSFQASWEFDVDILDNCRDINSLVEEMDKEEKYVNDENKFEVASNKTIAINEKSGSYTISNSADDLTPPRTNLLRQLSTLKTSACTSPTSTRREEEHQMLLMDNFASFSFDSLNSIDAGPATFDMDGIVSPDSHSLEGNLPTAVDILNELDKELEAEFLLS